MSQPKRNILQRYSFSKEKLREAVMRDPAVRAEAQAELAALAPFVDGGIHDGRCVISKEYGAVLREILGA